MPGGHCNPNLFCAGLGVVLGEGVALLVQIFLFCLPIAGNLQKALLAWDLLDPDWPHCHHMAALGTMPAPGQQSDLPAPAFCPSQQEQHGCGCVKKGSSLLRRALMHPKASFVILHYSHGYISASPGSCKEKDVIIL